MLNTSNRNILVQFTCLLFLPFVFVNQAQSQKSADDYQQSINDISREISKLSEQLNSSKAARDTERDKLFKAEKELKELKTNIRLKQEQIAVLEAQLIELNTTLDEQSADIEETRKTLASFIRKRYQNGRVDYLKSLLSQENPYAVGRLEHYHGYYRQALKHSYQEIARKIQTTLELQAQVQDQTEQRQAEEAQLEDLKSEQEQKTKAREQALRQLDDEINSKQKSLATLQANRARLSNLLTQLEAQAKKLREAEERRIKEARQRQQEQERLAREAKKPQPVPIKPPPRALVAGGFNKQKGRLQCPLSIKPKRLFGARLPESGMKSEGLFYDTQGSALVRSIFRGRVLFADFLKGYGLLIIVDHGDDHISLYGHNDRLLKKVGDAVDINETIAQTGVTGGLRSHGLYFEIRHNANPVDPSKWCR